MATETRKAERFANYRGDQRHAIGQIMGPDIYGSQWAVISADYSAATDRTRLGFAVPTVAEREAARA